MAKSKKNKKVLIATHNEDKFVIVRDLLISSGLDEAEFHNLRDFGVLSQVTEIGSVKNRAYMKAREAYNKLKGSGEQIDIYIGSDDAMQMPDGAVRVDSKEVTNEILNDGLLDIDELLTIVRAFSFIDKHGTEISRFETRIPFKFVGVTNNINEVKNKYPLNYVLSPMDSDTTIANMSYNESMNYYLRFCKNTLHNKLKEIT